MILWNRIVLVPDPYNEILGGRRREQAWKFRLESRTQQCFQRLVGRFSDSCIRISRGAFNNTSSEAGYEKYALAGPQVLVMRLGRPTSISGASSQTRECCECAFDRHTSVRNAPWQAPEC